MLVISNHLALQLIALFTGILVLLAVAGRLGR